MKCETLQLNIPLLSDDVLTEGELTELKAHLAQCPVCRSKHAEFLSLKNNLRNLASPAIPANLFQSVKNTVKSESKTATRRSSFFSESAREWMQFRLMPYSVGTACALLLTITFLYIMVATREATQNVGTNIMTGDAKSSILLASNKTDSPDQEIVLSEASYAALRLPVSMESPSLNPKGALLALTKSVVRGNMRDDEVTVVADVFSTGLAQIAQVVESSSDSVSINKLENAMENSSGNAPFVPANLDNRSNDMRVVFKIIWVDVDKKKPSVKKTSKK